jgi:hypothetical protein
MQPGPESWLERTMMVSSDECMMAHPSRSPPAIAVLILAGVWIWMSRLGRTGRIHSLLQNNAKKITFKQDSVSW